MNGYAVWYFIILYVMIKKIEMNEMENLTFEKRQLCDIQGRLFELARKEEWDCP